MKKLTLEEFSLCMQGGESRVTPGKSVTYILITDPENNSEEVFYTEWEFISENDDFEQAEAAYKEYLKTNKYDVWENITFVDGKVFESAVVCEIEIDENETEESIMNKLIEEGIPVNKKEHSINKIVDIYEVNDNNSENALYRIVLSEEEEMNVMTETKKFSELIEAHRTAVEKTVLEAMKEQHGFMGTDYFKPHHSRIINVILYRDGKTDTVSTISKHENIMPVYHGEACLVCQVETYDLSDWYQYEDEIIEALTEEEAEKLHEEFFQEYAVQEINEEIKEMIDEGIEMNEEREAE